MKGRGRQLEMKISRNEYKYEGLKDVESMWLGYRYRPMGEVSP